MKNKLSAVIFDYGCVISHPQNEDSVQRIIKHLSASGDKEFRLHYLRHRAELDAGKLTAYQYWQITTREMGLNLPDTEIQWLIKEDIESWTVVNQEMLHFISWLHQQGYTLAILSNMTHETLAYIHARDRWHHIFDFAFFSCDLGMVKPDPEIFRYVLDQLKVPGESCVFVDDTPVNCVAAEQFGIHAFRYTNLRGMKSYMSGLGIKIA